MPRLNDTCKELSNKLFNNALFKCVIVRPMHETTQRLYEAAKSREIIGQSNVARALGVSPQTVKNWETRGVSKAGIIKAQHVFFCNATWLATGEGVKELGKTTDRRKQLLDAAYENLSDAQKDQLLQICNTFTQPAETKPSSGSQ